MTNPAKCIVHRHHAAPAWTAWAIAVSLALHGVAYVSLGRGAFLPRPKPPNSVVSFEVTAPEPLPQPKPEPEPEPAPPEEAPAAPTQTIAPPRPIAQKTPEPAVTTQPPPTAPVDMSGLTLTNDLGVGFTMPSGNGLAREGALRVPASLGRDKVATASVPAKPTGPALVALADLSSRPSPPALEGSLERNYPPEARRRGLGGSATVRVRIDPDGVVRSVSALNESGTGFGEACRRTLRGSRWSPPRDRAGQAVATEVRYTCRFVVAR